MTPNKTQLRFLKTRCHALDPVVRIGQKGISDALMKELDIALAHHELIKIKVSIGDRNERLAAIRQIAERSNANIIQQIGQVAVLFKRNHEKPVIVFPK